jgi:hypothetical protein
VINDIRRNLNKYLIEIILIKFYLQLEIIYKNNYNCIADGKTTFILHKVEAVDEANLGYNYSLVGGTGLDESLEKVEFVTSVVAGSDGGSIVKISVKYHTKGDATLSDAVREETKGKGTGLLKAVEGYVLANPDY